MIIYIHSTQKSMTFFKCGSSFTLMLDLPTTSTCYPLVAFLNTCFLGKTCIITANKAGDIIIRGKNYFFQRTAHGMHVSQQHSQFLFSLSNIALVKILFSNSALLHLFTPSTHLANTESIVGNCPAQNNEPNWKCYPMFNRMSSNLS